MMSMSAKEEAEVFAAEIIHHLDEMYPDWQGTAAKTIRRSLRGALINKVLLLTRQATRATWEAAANLADEVEQREQELAKESRDMMKVQAIVAAEIAAEIAIAIRASAELACRAQAEGTG